MVTTFIPANTPGHMCTSLTPRQRLSSLRGRILYTKRSSAENVIFGAVPSLLPSLSRAISGACGGGGVPLNLKVSDRPTDRPIDDDEGDDHVALVTL